MPCLPAKAGGGKCGTRNLGLRTWNPVARLAGPDERVWRCCRQPRLRGFARRSLGEGGFRPGLLALGRSGRPCCFLFSTPRRACLPALA